MAVSLTDFDSEYTAALKIASESGVLVTHMRRLPDGEYEAWDNEFLAEPYSEAWLDLQYEHLAPLYPEVTVETYVWYLLDIWGDLDRGIYESLEDALPSVNAFLKAHSQREYQTVQMMQSDRAYRRTSDERMLPETSIARMMVSRWDGRVTRAAGLAKAAIRKASPRRNSAGGICLRMR